MVGCARADRGVRVKVEAVSRVECATCRLGVVDVLGSGVEVRVMCGM